MISLISQIIWRRLPKSLEISEVYVHDQRNQRNQFIISDFSIYQRFSLVNIRLRSIS